MGAVAAPSSEDFYRVPIDARGTEGSGGPGSQGVGGEFLGVKAVHLGREALDLRGYVTEEEGAPVDREEGGRWMGFPGWFGTVRKVFRVRRRGSESRVVGS